jgi:D-alanyl-D-alanine carboxypeptidase
MRRNNAGFGLMHSEYGLLGRTGMAMMRLAMIGCAATAIAAFAVERASAAPDAAIIVDTKTGKALYSENPDASRHPASLTKMMTLYLLFDALESGKASLDSKITFSAHAAAQAPSKLGLKPGQQISVRDAILAVVTKSANDVAVSIAEYLGGSESAFAQAMTKRARQLGMSRTTFVNASGLPDNRQITTARDMATLGRALQQHHPEYFAYFSTHSFVWKGRRIGNHNNLLGRVAGVNGIKTGYTRSSGYNLVTSVVRGSRQIVGVVLGGETSRARDKRMAGLIESYVPRASTGKMLASAVIPGNDAPVAVAVAAAKVPVPTAKPAPAFEPPPVIDAAVAANEPDPAPTIQSKIRTAAIDEATETASVQPKKTFGTVASLIGANSIFALDGDIEQGDTSADDEDASDAAPPASAAAPGWKIQLAATPTKDAAEDVLDRALSKGSQVLGDASPYTETVVRGETTLYRARFAGFVGKAQARAACAYLAKRDFQCLAISD